MENIILVLVQVEGACALNTFKYGHYDTDCHHVIMELSLPFHKMTGNIYSYRYTYSFVITTV